MIDWIQQHLIIAGITLGFLVVLGIALKAIPAMLEEKAMAALNFLFEKGDAADDEWLCATIKWAEAKYGAKSGAQKAAAVVDKIINLLPIQYRLFISGKVRAKAAELFQACFDRLEAAALAEMKEHGSPK
jgi:hypothetical protein